PPDFSSFSEPGAIESRASPLALDRGRPHRAVIDLAAKRMRTEQLLDRAAEFPTVAPGSEGREHALSYFALDNLGAIGKLDARTGKLSQHRVPSTQAITEPLFVPRANATREDDGWLVALGHDGPTNRAFGAVYDATRLEDGPVARAWFDHQVPITFHGTFAPVV